MRAALFYGKPEDMRIEKVEIPALEEGDILLKIRASGICGSDARSYFKGIEERYKIPVIFGHELTAEVFTVSGNVRGYSTGERVVVAPIYGFLQKEAQLLDNPVWIQIVPEYLGQSLVFLEVQVVIGRE